MIYLFYGNAYTVIGLMTLAQVFYGMAFAASPALYARYGCLCHMEKR
ncbi:MAG: hypothetical protein ACLTQN_01795 [Blautia massiliensis (ex Durand et al. 2017)]